METQSILQEIVTRLKDLSTNELHAIEQICYEKRMKKHREVKELIENLMKE